MTDIPLHYQSALAIGRRIQAGELTSVGVTEAMLARIGDVDPSLGAYLRTTPALALAQARQADQEISRGQVRSPLQGVPLAVKDLLDTQGINTTCGMPLNNDRVPTSDASVVQRLAQAGTVLLGKLKLTEGASGRHHPDVAPPRNPWDEDAWVGVSSSGSGVATAAGLCFASIGSDTGGSIRFPSAANGIVGLKPTWGRVSRAGVFPLAYSLDHVGPMTRSVADAAAMLQIIAGVDVADPTSSARTVPDYLAGITAPLKGLRVGIDEDYIGGSTDPEVVAAVRQVADCLAELGCQRVPVKVPARYLALCEGWILTTSVEALHGHAEHYPAQKAAYGEIATWLEIGSAVSAEDYMLLEMQRRAFKAELDGVFNQVDVILCPSMPFDRLDREGSPEADSAARSMVDTLKFTAPYNYSGSPTLSLPWQPGSKGIPLGVQLIGRDFEEDLLLRLGQAIEQQAAQGMHPPL